MINYGDKTNYPKIDIYVDNKYECSTTWAKSCKEAKEKFIDKHYKSLFMDKAQEVKARFTK